MDAAAGADPIVHVLEDPSCFQPANACANAGAAGQGECLLARKGGYGYFGNTTFAVVSEVTHSGKPLTVRFSPVP